MRSRFHYGKIIHVDCRAIILSWQSVSPLVIQQYQLLEERLQGGLCRPNFVGVEMIVTFSRDLLFPFFFTWQYDAHKPEEQNRKAFRMIVFPSFWLLKPLKVRVSSDLTRRSNSCTSLEILFTHLFIHHWIFWVKMLYELLQFKSHFQWKLSTFIPQKHVSYCPLWDFLVLNLLY